MMRAMAGWIALTPELPAKLLLGRQVWDCAQHAELRAPAHGSEPPGDGFVRVMDTLERPDGWEETLERLTGVYRVLKPHLIETYAAHLEHANPIYELPTRRILERCLADERRHVAEGLGVLDDLARAGAGQARVAAWETELSRLLGDAGGVTGTAR
jgi:hypothetical protein